MKNHYSKYTNEQLVSERDHAAKQEELLSSAKHMHSVKRSAGNRVTAVANELCKRLLEGSIVFDENGILVGGNA
jgi:hypothetical protein